jgi:heat shock protein HtpX
MDAPVKGLQSEIWANNAKSLFLLAVYPFILGGVALACVAAFGYFSGAGISFDGGTQRPSWAIAFDYAISIMAQYWPMIGAAVLIWFLIAYFFQGAMIRAMAHAHPVSRKEEPELYNLLENLCIAQGMKMPRLEIIETHARNAFASGINEQTFCVTVTRGLMQSLEKDELEAVVAHELAHIQNRDVRLLIVCVIFTGMLGVAAQLVWSNLRYMIWVPRSNDRRGGNGLILVMAIGAILWLGYLATLLTRFAISRKREYMADAGAVRMTKNPDAMMRALLRIAGAADIPKAPGDLKAMCFENATPFLGLFATHPPIASRVQAIADYSGLPAPALRPRQRADDVFAPPAAFRDNWTTRQRFKARRNANPWV